MKASTVLVTGAASGLGRYCSEALHAVGLTRANREEVFRTIEQTGLEAIVHCAFHQTKDPTSADLLPLLEDNVCFLKTLLEIPHQQFIFISSIDVYPRDGVSHGESEALRLEPLTFYAVQKLACEAMVKARATGPLILRVGSLLGPTSRPSNLLELLTKPAPSLSLTSDSEWNVVLQRDVCSFVGRALERRLTGVYNLVSTDNIRVEALALALGRRPKYGEFRYQAPLVDGGRAVKEAPAFARTSLETIQAYLGEIT